MTGNGTSAVHVEIRRGSYRDSVTLLRVSQAAGAVPGIVAAQVAMATPLNLELAVGLGFAIPDHVTPNDLLITLRGVDDEAVRTARAAVEAAMISGAPAATADPGLALARTVRAAAHANPDAPVVLLSVPGPAVLGEALDAIDAGRHVMIFSDNVPLADELAIKRAAGAAGVLAMGPDCGTAILGGLGLGFANVLRGSTGPRIGIVAASGTGAQHLSCLLDDAGVAVTHVLGVGGRDLSRVVGGRSTLAALDALDADPGTEHIAVISKPADPDVAAAVRSHAAGLTTPTTLLVIGPDDDDITRGAERLIESVGGHPPAWRTWASTPPPAGTRRGSLRGLYSGGTLADEAMVLLAPLIGDVRSNIPLRPDLALRRMEAGTVGHVVLDLGDDAFTVGRPHPMIDPTLRLSMLAEQAADSDVSVVLLDVVLGHAADPDPAAALGPAIADAVARGDLAVVVALCGTAADPQGRDRQAAALVAAGAQVFASNAAAARAAAALARPAAARGSSGGATPADTPQPGPDEPDPGEPNRDGSNRDGSGPRGRPNPDRPMAARGTSDGAMPADTPQPGPDGPDSGGAEPVECPRPIRLDLLAAPERVICAGVDLLADALRDQAVTVIPVDCRPAAVSPTAADALAAVLADPRRSAANEEVARRMLAVRAELVAVRPAGEALGLGPGEFCHAGPPITFDRASGPLRGALVGAMIFEGVAADPA
ncbi:MAG TPA: hypothetical protein VIU11_19330, partial [Nakamurella sp.]